MNTSKTPMTFVDPQKDFSTIGHDWACEACGSTVEELGVLGQLVHGRCRACGLDSSRPFLTIPKSGLDVFKELEEAKGAQLKTLLLGKSLLVPGLATRTPSLQATVADLLALGITHVTIDPEDQLLRDEEADEPFANDWKPRP